MSSHQEVQRQMFQSHLSYLAQEDESRRRALERVVGQYLTVVPHTRKFSSPPMAALFTGSPHTTAPACHALEKYATHLLTSPWRPEFKVLKLYSGFFQHVLKRHTTPAMALLQLMGYKLVDKHTLVVDEPIEPDRVARIALDCVIGYVECQVMIQISEKLQGKASWEEILKVRRNHVGGVEEAVRLLSERRPSLDRVPTSLLVDVFDTNDVLYLPPPSQFSSPASKKPSSLWLSEEHKNFRSDESYARPDTWSGSNNKASKYLAGYPYSGSYPGHVVDSLTSCQYCHHHDIPSPPPPPTAYHLSENFQNLNLAPAGKRDSFYDNLSPEESLMPPPPPPSKMVSNHRLLPKTPSSSSSKKKDNGALIHKKGEAVSNGSGGGEAKKKWACRFCTFLNKGDVAGCEMCGLNRDTTPLVMGRECPQCTLINHKTAEACTACNTSLKDSPTYI